MKKSAHVSTICKFVGMVTRMGAESIKHENQQVVDGALQTLQAAMKDADVTTEQLDWLVLHQANQRILDAAAQRIGISSERVVSNLAEYGNTSAASIPLAFDEAVRGGKIKNGDTVSILAPRSDTYGHE